MTQKTMQHNFNTVKPKEHMYAQYSKCFINVDQMCLT